MITLAIMKRWKIVLSVSLFIFASCKSTKNEMLPAENGLDAGREFIDGCLKGDFTKANFYMLQDEVNTQFLKSTEAAFRERDKEGRQELRLASINIKNVTEPNYTTVELLYSNSYDTSQQKLIIIQQNKKWFVDYKKSFK
jgi:hypothetical protein